MTNPFYASECFKSFASHNAVAIIAVAKGNVSNQRRMELLGQLKGMSASLEPGMLATVQVASVIFNDDTSYEDRATFMFSTSQQHAATVAAEWAPTTVVGAVGKLLLPVTPSFAGTLLETFKKACEAISNAELLGQL